VSLNFKGAYKAYLDGDILGAKRQYEALGEMFGASTVEHNIYLCEKKLAEIESVDIYSQVDINTYFDFIYLVNLKGHTQRRLTATKHLRESGIKFQVFDAVNGYKGEPLETYNSYNKRELGTLKRYPDYNEKEKVRGKGFIESAGAVGYIYTYINIMKHAQKAGYKKILILEDDVLLDKNFKNKFKRFIANVPESWKVLQLGASQYEWSSVNEEQSIKEGHYFPRRLDTCGSFALALDSDVFDLLIEAESAFEAPFDHLPLGEIYEKHLGECFVAYPNIVMPCVADSSIRGGRCQATHGAKMKWVIDNFDYPLAKANINVLIQSTNNLKYLDRFNGFSSLPYNLRLFINTIDGIRPLHQQELLELDYNALQPVEGEVTLPESDFSFVCPEDIALTEEMILAHVENIWQQNRTHSSGLQALDTKQANVVKGRVSVIIPTYKRPKNLNNALTSVADQDYKNKEVIVVCDNGDGSEYNDETQEIVDSVRKDFPDVVIKLIFHRLNRNGAAARNTGFLSSCGEYISLLDDDDIYLPGRLTETVIALKNSAKKVGAVYCGFLGWNSPENNLERYAEGDLTKEILLLDYMKHYLHTNTATYKRTAYEALNGFDESYRRHQDLEFNLRFFEFYEIKAVKKALVRLNPEPSDISNKVFNLDMLDLKTKFLNQFSLTAYGYGHKISKEIYEKHWDEVVRYIENPKEMAKKIDENFENGYLNVRLKVFNKSKK